MIDAEYTPQEAGQGHAAGKPAPAWFGFAVRTIARLWVIALLLLAAAFGGIAVNQFFQAETRLAELRKAPGPDAYAVVAYRRELERQIHAQEQGRQADIVPAPPARPRLLEEIDLARPRDRDNVVRGSGDLAPISAPQ